MPQIQTLADDICILKSLHTEAINHDPAVTFFQTGSQQAGRPSIGAWLSYGLGSENENLPAFIAMVSQGTGKNPGQPIFSRLWGSGFLPSKHQGVNFRAGSDPVLYLSDPDGFDREMRRRMLDALVELFRKAACEVVESGTWAFNEGARKARDDERLADEGGQALDGLEGRGVVEPVELVGGRIEERERRVVRVGGDLLAVDLADGGAE